MSFYDTYAWVYDQSSVWVDRYEEPHLIKYDMDTEYVSNVYKHVMEHATAIAGGYFQGVPPEVGASEAMQDWMRATKLCRALVERLEADGRELPEHGAAQNFHYGGLISNFAAFLETPGPTTATYHPITPGHTHTVNLNVEQFNEIWQGTETTQPVPDFLMDADDDSDGTDT